jgi:ribonuclease BN (tRNA processing enzyme)
VLGPKIYAVEDAWIVQLTVVGCSGGHPSPDAACSAYLLEHDGFRLLLDLGSGALGPLRGHLDPRDVDAVFLTHLHADHWFDLAPLMHARMRHPDGRVPPRLRVLAPAGAAESIAIASLKPVDAVTRVYAFEEPSCTSVGPFEVQVLRVEHPAVAYAIRAVAGGRSVVYTGDTGPFPELAAFASGTDLLLAEAGFVNGRVNPAGIHLTGRQAGELARDGDVGRLVVTHVMPWDDRARQLDDAATVFRAAVGLAAPGDTYAVGACL